jgi:enoyl-CoA hydratase
MASPLWAHGEVRVDLAGENVAVLTLDAPRRRNAVTPGMAADIAAAADFIETSDDVGAVVVTGTPPAFCAGAALAQLDQADEQVLRQLYAAFLRVRQLPLPTVAAVGGPAVGAGLNLALACDLRVASTSAVFDSRFAKIGLHPGGGVTWLLRSAAGQPTATAMLLFGQKISGAQAAERGLAWTCVDDDEPPASLRACRPSSSAA